MSVFPMNRKPIATVVEYTDEAGNRTTESFPNAPKARKFYIKAQLAGAAPRVVRAVANVPSVESQVRSSIMVATKSTKATTTNKSTKATKAAATGEKGLTPKQIDVLKALSKKSLSKGDLWEQFKAGSSVLGAGTKDNPSGLQGMGYIQAEKHEGERQMKFVITAAGRKALANASK